MRSKITTLPLVLVACCVLLLADPPAVAQRAGEPVVVKSKNSFADTVSKLKSAIQQNQMMVLFEANHKNMMAMVGVESKNSVTVLFGRPQMGAMLMGAEPKAALEMPMRIAVRELDNGEIVVIYYKPSYLLSHYKNAKLDPIGRQMDAMLQKLVDAATK
ncbi:hypothetical protein HRbin08_00021 [bacterium HR08]|nr:hypothetical protein HRbin08_00021 [bacterium HR08]